MTKEEKTAIAKAKIKIKNMSTSQLTERRKEIIARARKVYDISFGYHLTHAVLGSDELLTSDLMEANKNKFSAIRKATLAAIDANDKTLVKELNKKKEKLSLEIISKKYHILVRYVNMDDGYGGRVLVHDLSKKYIILLPNKLKENIMDKNGQLQKKGVELLRKKMAHELGHVVLHANLLPKNDQIGSSALDDPLDKESVIFETEILRLYRKKDHRINYESA